VLVPEPSQPGAFAAVRSRSTQVLLRNTTPDGSTLRKAEDWIFDARAHDAQADSPPVAASAVALPSSATLR
jgi:hypothetical protein